MTTRHSVSFPLGNNNIVSLFLTLSKLPIAPLSLYRYTGDTKLKKSKSVLGTNLIYFQFIARQFFYILIGKNVGRYIRGDNILLKDLRR